MKEVYSYTEVGALIEQRMKTGVHTIQIDSVEELDCYGREIRKALHS